MRALAPFGLAAAALALAGCGGGALAREPFSSVTSALERAGLEICRVQSPASVVETASSERLVEVGESCPNPGNETTVLVIAWPDASARDAALRRFDVQSRPSAQNHGNTWSYAQYTISVSGERDEDVVARVVDAMHALGAS